ncbi:MAG: hypothetical protein HYZ49_07885 [Chloroflexi bacterium]|nr:hypothetical protein [Chloroflexota bacterium]
MRRQNRFLAGLFLSEILCFGISWAGDNVWTSSGPYEGKRDVWIAALVLDPSVPTTVYAGTTEGVYKSLDGGVTWAEASVGLTSSAVAALAVDPGATQTVYAGTDYGGGVFKSVDGGVSWTAANNGLPDATDKRNIDALIVDPSTPQTVYAGTWDGVYKSMDGGASWVAINNGMVNCCWSENLHVYAMAMDPSAPQTIYAGGSGGAYKSVDGGENWTRITGNLSNPSFFGLMVDPRAGQIVYAIADNAAWPFRSPDGGVTWVPGEDRGFPQSRTVAVSPSTPQAVYAGTTDGVYRSVDGGKTWAAFNDDEHHDIVSLAVSPTTPQTLYAGTTDGRVYMITLTGPTVVGTQTWGEVKDQIR